MLRKLSDLVAKVNKAPRPEAHAAALETQIWLIAAQLASARLKPATSPAENILGKK